MLFSFCLYAQQNHWNVSGILAQKNIWESKRQDAVSEQPGLCASVQEKPIHQHCHRHKLQKSD